MSLKSAITRVPGYHRLRQLVHETSTQIVFAQSLVSEVYSRYGEGLAVLDLGCGEGNSSAFFRALDPTVVWRGVDIVDSPEVQGRSATLPGMTSFDGINLPYEANYFDIVYSHQVFEHVREPHPLMRDVVRVLKPGGYFVGSVAYLEPYHSFSVFNFTPFGMVYLMEATGLVPETLHHCYDAAFTIIRQLSNRSRFIEPLRSRSALYLALEIVGRMARLDAGDINLVKLQFSGAFCFVGRKPGAPE